MRAFLWGLIGLTAVMAAACSSIVGYRAAPVAGEVVDAATGSPLPDTLIVIVWRLQRGPHSQDVGLLYVEETQTDAAGRYRFDGWSGRHTSEGSLAPGMPELIFFKRGYAPRTIGNDVPPWRPGQNGETVRSDWDGRKIELPQRADTAHDYYLQASALARFFVPTRERRCDWIKTPRLTGVALDLGRYFESQRIDNDFPTLEALRLSGCGDPRTILGGTP